MILLSMWNLFFKYKQSQRLEMWSLGGKWREKAEVWDEDAEQETKGLNKARGGR